MGLDMYLTGRKYFYRFSGSQREEDGFQVRALDLDLGYWRKHPDLHGYIVQAFAEGRDECQKIELGMTSLSCIISAVKEKRLPHTEGFFFGASRPEEASTDIKTFEAALAWLKAGVMAPPLDQGARIAPGLVMHKVTVPDPEIRESRSVIYRASW